MNATSAGKTKGHWWSPGVINNSPSWAGWVNVIGEHRSRNFKGKFIAHTFDCCSPFNQPPGHPHSTNYQHNVVENCPRARLLLPLTLNTQMHVGGGHTGTQSKPRLHQLLPQHEYIPSPLMFIRPLSKGNL